MDFFIVSYLEIITYSLLFTIMNGGGLVVLSTHIMKVCIEIIMNLLELLIILILFLSMLCPPSLIINF